MSRAIDKKIIYLKVSRIIDKKTNYLKVFRIIGKKTPESVQDHG